jgi:hypothetical protein
MICKQATRPDAGPATKDPFQEALDRKLDEALDEALDSTYPASDPVALVMPHRGSRGQAKSAR